MCGIIGYIGNKSAAPILIEGLKRMEYRGYDSAGIALVGKKSDEENSLQITKQAGRVSELESQKKELQESEQGIAHTRWATHGAPNKINAHPHTDCKGNIALVHNGIIENYLSLKEMLTQEGHIFKSQTDTEVLVHLIEKFYQGDLEKAVAKALKLVEGTYGIAVTHKNESCIIAARHGSPILLGIGKEEMFVVSDASAVLEHTKAVVYLKDKEVAKINKDSYSVKNLNGEKVDSEIKQIQWNLSQIEKGGFQHFTLKEIFEQPESVANTLRGRIKENQIKLSLNLDLNFINKINRIIIVGCGTSWHSALIGKNYLERFCRIPVEVDYASEFRYRNPIISKKDLVIAISQSGETADTLAAIKHAKLQGAKTLGIINVVDSTIAREVDSGIYLHAGPEIGVASTKAFSSQLTALLLLSLYFAEKKKLKIAEEFLNEISTLPELIKKTLQLDEKIIEIAKKFSNAKNFLYLGRGINFPVAIEGALKLKEISYIPAEGYPAAEMKHGPIALIDENLPVVFLAPKNQDYLKIISNMQEVKARNGKIIVITNNPD
ncbi:MAG TPA: glutamine--fructose-6-phosphate transaminase (isomerizing), partial [Candidatus Pacearchaeota archaeon]|nr:glutamine--fructose-6-phosphate transaminase (isomerizing) [Candidatus Pacearchaeota archaeon]